LHRRPAGRRAGGEFRQYGHIPFGGADAHTGETGNNVGMIARANAITGSRSERTRLGLPALTPEGATMAADASDRERQQREVEEIRRKFTEIGARVGSFEPTPEPTPDDDQDQQAAQPAQPAASPTRPLPPRAAVAAVAMALLAGTGLGYALPRASAPRAATPLRPVGTQAPTSTVAVRVVTRVPPSCLEAARKGDLTIHLYTINVRDRRLVEALKAYTLASQACRKEASP
jgi:hypothetical protein